MDDFKGCLGENIYTSYIPFVLTDLYLLKHPNVKVQDPLVLNEQKNPSWEGMKPSVGNGARSLLLFKVQISSPLLVRQNDILASSF